MISALEQYAALRRVDFDVPFTVGHSGNVYNPALTRDVHAPEVFHDPAGDITIYGEGWEPLTGYTGQYGYSGAVMHASETLGGRLADDILTTPGVYVLTVVEVMPSVTFPHDWSASGARCTACGLIGNGTDNGSCTAHPDYDPGAVDDDEDPEPAGWAVLRRTDV